jgi:hypothetical protein
MSRRRPFTESRAWQAKMARRARRIEAIYDHVAALFGRVCQVNWDHRALGRTASGPMDRK